MKEIKKCHKYEKGVSFYSHARKRQKGETNQHVNEFDGICENPKCKRVLRKWRRWAKHFHTMESDLLLIPINRTGHWSLVSICNPAQCLKAKVQVEDCNEKSEDSSLDSNEKSDDKDGNKSEDSSLDSNEKSDDEDCNEKSEDSSPKNTTTLINRLPPAHHNPVPITYV